MEKHAEFALQSSQWQTQQINGDHLSPSSSTELASHGKWEAPADSAVKSLQSRVSWCSAKTLGALDLRRIADELTDSLKSFKKLEIQWIKRAARLWLQSVRPHNGESSLKIRFLDRF